MREIKFRAWDTQAQCMLGGGGMQMNATTGELNHLPSVVVMQYTGLKDRNGLTDIYEGDIIGVDGIVRGNKYENASLLRDETNLVIQGFGTSAWEATNQEAVGRGCKYSE